jgi:hypothetical protein
VSYDLTIAAHQKPTRDVIGAWASEQGFEAVTAADGHSYTIQKAGRGDAGYICEVWGPDPAEPEDFDEELAAACLAPNWMLQVSSPYSVPKANLAHARSLARYIAERTDGAAYDPQEERLLWPRGKKSRTPSRTTEQATSMLTLEWFVAPSRWQNAVASLVPLLAPRCPEALPTRYGSWEPPPHRFDRAEPDPFVDFVARSEDGDGFWYASKPSFGGSFIAPHADEHAKPADERFRIGKLEISFDGNLIAADEKWREGIVELFVRGAETFRAFFAAAQVESGWTVSRNNRPWATGSVVQESEHFLRGRLWQGLPPVPIWLSFYGHPYRELVAEAVHRPPQEATERPRKTLLGRLIGGAEAHPFAEQPQVDDRQGGIFVRLSRDPLPRPQLPRLPLPDELIYRERRAIEYPNGGRGTNPAQADDRAAVIPDLEIAVDRANPD